jgi:hypothetical protein
MAGMTNLRDASHLIEPTLAELEVPASDAPLLALARRMAATIDAMPDAMAGTMLPNHAGPFLKALAELEDRAAKRRARTGAGRPNRVSQLRAAHASTAARRKRTG